MKTSDIPDLPVLKLLQRLEREEIEHSYLDGLGRKHSFRPIWGTLHHGFPQSVSDAMGPDIPIKLSKSKMASMIKRGLVDGCACGCRGDFELTDKGRKVLENQPK